MIDNLPDKLLFRDSAEFVTFCQYEAERRAKKERDGGGRPLGLRLSTVCPQRMVKAVFDPKKFSTPIDEGDAERGHEMESRYRAIVLRDIEHEYQPVVDWGIGISAFDFLVDGQLAELKSTIGAMTMHTDWRTTTERRMVANNMSAGSVVDVYAVHPGNLDLRGPFHVELSAQLIEEHGEQLAAIRNAYAFFAPMPIPEKADQWDSAEWWELIGLPCKCGWCEPLRGCDASPALERMIARYHLHRSVFEDAVADAGGVLGWKVKTKDYLDDGLHRKIINACESLAGESEDGRYKVSFYAADYDAVRDKAGKWQIKVRKEKAQQVAA